MFRSARLSLFMVAALACSAPVLAAQGPSTAQPHNTLTAAERAAGWRLLFDGKTTTGWRGYQMREMPPEWKVVDGILMKEVGTEDIVTTETFADFELVLEWKVERGGNSGLFYRATEEYPRVYWSAVEYQLLDDANARDGQNPLTSAAAVYGMYPAPRGIVKTAGEWNTTRVVARGARVEHWLNGQKVAEYDAASTEWATKVEASKFKDWPNFAKARSGVIAIQGDHRGILSLRNMKIRPLN